MATNEILQFASQDTGSNLLTQTEYEGDAQRVIGHQPGIARSRLENKVLRQTSLMAAGLAQFMAANQSGDITDGLSAQDIADALNLSLENKIASVGTGGIKLLQSTPVAPPVGSGLIAENHASVVLELTADNGESIIVGAFRHQISTSSTYQPGSALNFEIAINITGATKTNGTAIESPTQTYSANNVETDLVIYPQTTYANSKLRYGLIRGRTTQTSFTLNVGAVFFVI